MTHDRTVLFPSEELGPSFYPPYYLSQFSLEKVYGMVDFVICYSSAMRRQQPILLQTEILSENNLESEYSSLKPDLLVY